MKEKRKKKASVAITNVSVKSDILDANESDSENPYDSRPNDDYLIMGLSKGTIIFVKVDDLESIYARFSVHNQQVDHIYEMQSQKKILSICAEFLLKIWGFTDNKLQVYRTYFMYRPVEFVKTIEEPTMVYLVFPAGDSVYLLWDEQENGFRQILNDRSNEHEEHVTSIDVHYGKRLIVTGDTNGLIKLWNYKKELIREVKFTEPVSAVCFQDEEGDLLVGHEGKLSRIEAKNYLPKTTVADPKEKTATGFEARFNEIIAQGQEE